MKKLLALIFAVSTLMVACKTPNDIPAPQLEENIKQIPPGTVFGTVSEDELESPKRYGNGKLKLAKFTVIEEVYDETGSKILIPRGAIVTGLYENDGSKCLIKWKAIYANEEAYENEKAAFQIEHKARNSICKSSYGIKQGSKVTIKFE